MPIGVSVEIKPAKERPMPTWVGKQPFSRVTAFPAQLVETFIPTVAVKITDMLGEEVLITQKV